MNTSELINKLNLQKHPEGGYFKEIYRSNEIIPLKGLHPRYQSDRNVSTHIYYLLEKTQKSNFHRLKSDEIWHFYSGESIIIHCINNDGVYSKVSLGQDIVSGESYTLIIPKGVWFAAELKVKENYALVGCTVAPGFDFNDFELANKVELEKLFPQHKEIIKNFT